MAPFRIILHHLAEVTSTNDEAKRMAERGAPEGTMVWADHQTRGRGRHGRMWFSSPGHNILTSLVLRPQLAPHQLGLVTMMGAVAVADAIDEVTGTSPHIKWPNDVLIRGRKVSGMLLESTRESRADAPPQFVILGMGVNVNETSFPVEIEASATSLKLETGREIPRESIVASLMSRLAASYRSMVRDSGKALHESYVARLAGIGHPTTIHFQGTRESATGHFLGVTLTGGLELELGDGRREIFHAGEVTIGEAFRTESVT